MQAFWASKLQIKNIYNYPYLHDYNYRDFYMHTLLYKPVNIYLRIPTLRHINLQKNIPQVKIPVCVIYYK